VDFDKKRGYSTIQAHHTQTFASAEKLWPNNPPPSAVLMPTDSTQAAAQMLGG